MVRGRGLRPRAGRRRQPRLGGLRDDAPGCGITRRAYARPRAGVHGPHHLRVSRRLRTSVRPSAQPRSRARILQRCVRNAVALLHTLLSWHSEPVGCTRLLRVSLRAMDVWDRHCNGRAAAANTFTHTNTWQIPRGNQKHNPGAVARTGKACPPDAKSGCASQGAP